jgi:hypothetical protein
MAKRRIHKLCPALVTIAFASAALLVSAQPANAASALFRAKRTWWFSQADSWTDGHVEPRTGKGSYEPPALAGVGPTATHPAFTAPKSFIKNTTYTFMCPFYPYCYPNSSGIYSYWNGRGNFRPQNPYAPTTTTTIRVRTTMDGYNPTLMGWPTAMKNVRTAMGRASKTITVATPAPTARYSRITPTEGGCTGPIALMIPPAGASCPGTTQFNGYYRYDRGGSIMIWPGGNRFGGTMRWFSGPNARYYQLRTIDGPYTAITFPPAPLSLQIPSSVETRIGEVEAVPSSRGFHYQLTEPYHIERRVIGLTPSGANCTLDGIGVFPDCRYLQKTVQYLATRAPYTTGMVQIWQPNGNTNTIQTATGYDNRTQMGLSGTISLVHPRLTHSYLIDRSIDPNKPIKMSWSSARMRKIDFRMLPEPRGMALLASGLAMLAGLYRLRGR